MGSTSGMVLTVPNSREMGLMYSHTSSPPAVTSKRWPLVPEQIKVLPLVNRCEPEPMWLKNP